MASIYVLKGDGKGKQFELADGSNIVGRKRTCSIRFNDIEMSRNHLDLELDGENLYAIDLDSANGTYVNGVRLEKKSRLQSGDRLMVGQVQLLVNLAVMTPISDSFPVPDALSHSIDVLDDEESLANIRSVKNDLDFLYNASYTASNAQETDGMLEKLLKLVFDWVDVDRGAVLLWDEATQGFIPRFLKHRKSAKPGPIQFSRTIIDYVNEKRQGILTGNASDDPRWPSKGSILLDGIEEVICVPIRGRAEIYGLIYVDRVSDDAEDLMIGSLPSESAMSETGFSSPRPREKNRLNDDHLKLMATIAHQAAMVIENREFNIAVVHSERLSAVGQTLSAMSHHIKNILQSINCGEHLVDEGLNANQADTIRQGWDIVQRNQKEMSQLVMDMLTLSKKNPPHLNLGDLAKCVSKAIEEIQDEAHVRDIAIRYEQPTFETGVRFEYEMMIRAVTSVIQFYLQSETSSENGRPVKNTSGAKNEIAISILDGGKEFTVQIEDNFLSLHDRDFDRFFELLSYTHDKTVRGISLPVCHKIMQEHGGDVSVTAVGKRGLCFRLCLPGVSSPSEQKTGYFRKNSDEL